MERYLGIDVHRDSSTICVLGPTGKRVRQDLVETNGRSLVQYVSQLAGRRHICFEESPWSEWLYEILSPHVAELVVFQDEWRPGSKSDSIDAHGLAEKLRLGLAGPGVFKSPHSYRKLREWARVYQALTRDLARVKNRLKAQFLRRGLRCEGNSVYNPDRRAEWLQQLPEVMRGTVELLCFELDGLRELKAAAEVRDTGDIWDVDLSTRFPAQVPA